MTDEKTFRGRLDLWGISEAEAAALLGSDRAAGDFSAAAELLERRLAPERIAAVVRRPAELLEGRSLRDLALAGEHAALREAVFAMFDLRRVQP